MKDQVRCLDAFKRDETQTSYRLKSAKDLVVKKMLEDRLNHIQEQIEKLTLTIRNLAHADPVVAAQMHLLMSIPGVTETTALSLLGELPDLPTFKCTKQLAAFAGLNPSIMTSGTSVKGKEKILKTGNKVLRKILSFPAMAVMRIDSSLKQFVERLRGKNKKGKVIVAAVMRKLLHVIFGLLKTQTVFQDQYR